MKQLWVGFSVIVALFASSCARPNSAAVEQSLDTAAVTASVVATTAPVASPPATVGPDAPTPVIVQPVATADPTPAPAPATPEPAATSVASTPEPAATSVASTPEPAATSVASTPEPAATSVPAVPSNDSEEARVANGGEVYTLNCARCHAENGLGTAQYSGLIRVGSKYSTEAMIEELTNGHPVTFGFADRLSADEIVSVVAYVKATFP